MFIQSNYVRNCGMESIFCGRACCSGALHYLREYCATWVGIALLNFQCNAVLSGALVLYLVHCFVAMKPVTPLRGENVGFSGVEGSQW